MYAPGLSRPSILRNGCCGRCCCACLTQAGVHAERIAALHMTEPHAERSGRITIAADKGYDTGDFVNELRSMNVAPRGGQGQELGRRRTHDPPCQLQGQPARSQADRGSLWLGQVGRLRKTSTAASLGSAGSSPSPWPPTTSSGCRNCSPIPRDGQSTPGIRSGSPANAIGG